jgi:hypothetical protein
MREYDMTAVYTVAAVPLDVSKSVSKSAVPLPVKMPYTFADAAELAEKYNSNPVYKGILRNRKFSHFVPFNLSALQMDPPPYYVGSEDA